MPLEVPDESRLQATLDRPYRNAKPWTTLWHLYDGEHRNLFIAVILFIIKHSPTWMLPVVTGNIVNALVEIGKDPDTRAEALHRVYINAAVMIVFFLQNVPVHTWFISYLCRAMRHVQMLLRSALVLRIQQLSISFHDDFQSGRMHSKVLRDVEQIEILTRQLFITILPGVLAVLIGIAVTLVKAPVVTAFYVLTIPVAVVLIRFFQGRISERSRLFRKELESMSARMSEMIEMVPVTRAHAAEEHEVQRMTRQLQRIRYRGLRLDITNELFASSTWTSFQLFQLSCLLFTGYLAYTGRIQVGDMFTFQGFFTLIVGSVSQMLGVYPQMIQGFESIRSLGEILESPDVEQNDGKRPVQRVHGAISFEHVGFTYPGTDQPAVIDFNLDVAPGECVAFVGESGSGKSTLMNLVIGFRRPTSGRILLDGQDMAALNLRQFRRFLSVVPQHTVLFSGTIKENLTYGLEGVREADVLRAAEAANVMEFVARLPQGLDTRIGEHGGKLSGGQRQRIAIARALLRDPRVIILDEATSALDVISEKLVQDAIDRLISGRTTFIVAHRLSTIRKANRIVVMKNGRVLEVGTNDELLARSSEFSRLRRLQM